MRKIVKVSIVILSLILSACSPYTQGMGPRTHVPDIKGDHFITADGLELPVHVWETPQKPKAIILGVHGFNDFGNFLTPGFPKYLQDHDILLLTYDQRGFGQNKNRGIWAGTDALVNDLTTLIHLVHARHEDIPLFVLGESMGGGVAMTTLAQITPLPVKGLILSAPAVWGPSTWPWYPKAALYTLSYSVPWLKLRGGGIVQPTDHIENWKNWSLDPLTIRETRVDALWGVSWLMDDAQAAAPELKTPTLVLYGEKDQIIPLKATQTLVSKLDEKHQIALYPEGWHWLTRDLNGPLVWKDIVSWTMDQKAPLPSGADVGAREKLLLKK